MQALTHLAPSDGDGPLDVNHPVWRNRATAGQELVRVVKEDDAVAQQAPPLLGVEWCGPRHGRGGQLQDTGADVDTLLASGSGIAGRIRTVGHWLARSRVILVTGIARPMRAAAAAGITRKCGRMVQLAAAMTGRGEPDSALISAAMAG
jgi:hypothetical protein